MKSLYFLINFCSIIVPFLFSFHPRLRFNQYFKEYFISAFLISIPFLAWDVYFTSQGIWGFNPDYVSGVKLISLPLEEVLFFFCIPFSCMFTIHCMGILSKITLNERTENLIVILLSLSLLAVGFYFRMRSYTCSTFIGTGIVLLSLKYIMRVKWLPKIFLIYPILLIPFFIVNGILTGTGIEAPVVWYNNEENLGMRIFTIPVEDFIYGFELILLNLAVYEYLKERKNRLAFKIPLSPL